MEQLLREIRIYIISFVPTVQYRLVCKEWSKFEPSKLLLETIGDFKAENLDYNRKIPRTEFVMKVINNVRLFSKVQCLISLNEPENYPLSSFPSVDEGDDWFSFSHIINTTGAFKYLNGMKKGEIIMILGEFIELYFHHNVPEKQIEDILSPLFEHFPDVVNYISEALKYSGYSVSESIVFYLLNKFPDNIIPSEGNMECVILGRRFDIMEKYLKLGFIEGFLKGYISYGGNFTRKETKEFKEVMTRCGKENPIMNEFFLNYKYKQIFLD